MVHIQKGFKKIRRLRFVIIGTIVIGFTGLFSYFIYNSYHEQIRLMRQEKLLYLQGIVRTLALQIPAEHHDAIINADSTDVMQWEGYKILRNQLHEVQKANSLKTDIYTLSKLPDSSGLFFILNSGTSPLFKHNYVAPSYLLKNYTTGGAFGPYEDEHGHWLSAFAPILRADGSVSGIVQADLLFEQFQDEIVAHVLDESINMSMQFGAVLLVLLLMATLTSKYLNQSQNELEKLTEELQLRNGQLQDAQEEIVETNKQLSGLNAHLEAEVQKRTETINQRNRDLHDFLYHAGHKMKSPVVNIQGLLQLLNMEQNSEDVRDLLTKVEDQTGNMHQMLEKLNQLGSMDYSLKAETFNLNELIMQLMHNHHLGALVHTEYRLELLNLVHTDRNKLTVALQALIENALHFSYSTKSETASVHIQTQQKRTDAIMAITNNGAELPEDKLDKIWNMFFVGSRHSKGNGLGLYLAKRACESIGAKLTNNSQNPITFSITLYGVVSS